MDTSIRCREVIARSRRSGYLRMLHATGPIGTSRVFTGHISKHAVRAGLRTIASTLLFSACVAGQGRSVPTMHCCDWVSPGVPLHSVGMDGPIRPIVLSNGHGVMHPQTRGNPRTQLNIRNQLLIFLLGPLATPMKASFRGESTEMSADKCFGPRAACRLRLD